MDTRATHPAPQKGPDPNRIRPGASTAPSRSAGLLSLVHSLIAFGEALLCSLQAAPATAMLASLASRFGARDLAVIVARITRGLMLASALEDRLVRNGTRLDAPRGRATPAAAASRNRPARLPLLSHQDDDAALRVRLPTAQEIAARVRSKPIGIVLEAICHDLGITCDHPLWPALRQAILGNGGSLPEVHNNMMRRVAEPYLVPRARVPAPLPASPLSAPVVLANTGTGPP